tara:strand:+ start:3369 stop:4208 length:840 start_codon:yes stop_codon:yes gene_type:complete
MTTPQVPTIEQEKLNITEMQMELQKSGSIDNNDTLYLGEILELETSKTAKGNPYKKFQMQLFGAQGRTYWNQFNGLEKATVSGQLVRNVQKGDLIVWSGIIKPNPTDPAKEFCNINQLITKVVSEPDSLFDEVGGEVGGVTPDPLDDTPTERLLVEGKNLVADFDKDVINEEEEETTVGIRNLPSKQQETDRYIKANNVNSISIERQVSVKAATELTLERARLAESVIANFPWVGIASVPEIVNICDALWSWVCIDSNHHDTGVVERAASISLWLEFNK